MAEVNLERWRVHLEGARRMGSISRYAREQGLSRHTLYAAQRQQKAEAGGRRGRVKREPRFVPVRIAPLAGVPVRLANGVELRCETWSPELLQWLAGLPCSV